MMKRTNAGKLLFLGAVLAARRLWSMLWAHHGRTYPDFARREMDNTPYSRFDASELILRDELAIDRTLLANERTAMAYVRLAVALFIAGVSIIHFATEWWFWLVGVACLPSAVITSIVGLLKYRRMNRSIAALRSQLKATGVRETNGE